MVFSSILFLLIFLPLVILTVRIAPQKWKNPLLTCWSLLFYAWGGVQHLPIFLCVILINWITGLLLDRAEKPGIRRFLLILCLALNLGNLGYFKYFDFAAGIMNGVFGHTVVTLRNIALPIGISFYTFQALSYVIDVYRGDVAVQKDPLKLCLYISLFPQLIAGPIVNYGDVHSQLDSRRVSTDDMAYGVKRFVFGLGKKVLLANELAAVSEAILAIPPQDIPWSLALMGALAYALQIYYDFSGYSDMAIGLGRMFGFRFAENFNYPYLAQSVSDFWKRWHISLTDWFRRYLYIPLGGNRKGRARTVLNIAIVFTLTGLWHGACWQFIAWGVWHGFFMCAERILRFHGREIKGIFGRIYTLLEVLIGWILFACPAFQQGLGDVRALLTLQSGSPAYRLSQYYTPRVWLVLFFAVLLCGPLQQLFPTLKKELYREEGPLHWGIILGMAAVFFLSLLLLAAGTYNPFIYFRF